MRFIGLLLVVSLAPVLAGCGGGGGGGGGGGAPAPVGTPASVGFPPDGGVTDATAITLRGTAGTGTTLVRVNGVPATSTDGFASWQAVVSLTPGANDIVVSTENAAGEVRTRAAVLTVERQELLLSPSGLDHDAAGDRFLLIEEEELVSVDPANGIATIVSGDARGGGPDLEDPGPVAVDAANGRALVPNESGSDREILSVDLATGDRTVVSGPTTGTGPSLESAGDLVYDAAGKRVFILVPSGILAVDLATGDRTELASLTNPSALTLDAANSRLLVLEDDKVVSVGFAGSPASISAVADLKPDLNRPADLAFDASRDALFALDSSRVSRVFEVDLATGGITAVAGDGVGSGPELSWTRDLVADTFGRLVVVESDDGEDRLVAVDPANGNRTVLFDSGRGTGPFIDDPRDFAYDTRRDRFVVVDSGSGSQGILAVDRATGNRRVISSPTVGSGPDVLRPEGVAYDPAGDRLFVADGSQPALFIVDAADGDRTILSDAATGAGPMFDAPRDVAYDAAGDRVLVISLGLDAIIAVDLATGDRTIVSDDSTGAGPDLEGPEDLELDLPNNRLLVTDASLDALLAVDLSTGDRTILSDATIGTGPESTDRGIWLDRTNGRVLGVGSRTLLSTDLASGDRTVISDDTRGTGPRAGSTLRDVIVLADGLFAYVLDDSQPNAIYAFDLETGERVVFSK